MVNAGHLVILIIVVGAATFLAIAASMYFGRQAWDRGYPGVELRRGRTAPPRARGNHAIAFAGGWVATVMAWVLLVNVVIIAVGKIPPKPSQSALLGLQVAIDLVGFFLLMMVYAVITLEQHNEQVRRDRPAPSEEFLPQP